MTSQIIDTQATPPPIGNVLRREVNRLAGRSRWVLAALIACVVTSVSALVVATPAAATPTVSWTLDRSQHATDVATNGRGDVWVIGTTRVPGGYTLHHRTPSGAWETVPGGATRIALEEDGTPWVVNEFGEIFRRWNNGWQLIPGRAHDIAAGQDGVFVIGNNPVLGGYGIYSWSGNELQWARELGGAVRVGAGTPGGTWVVNDAGRVFRFSAGRTWVAVPGTATDVTAGGGQVWIVGTKPVPGGFEVRRFDGVDWVTVPGGGVAIAGGAQGPWLANSYTELFSGILQGLDQALCPIDGISVPESSYGVYAATVDDA